MKKSFILISLFAMVLSGCALFKADIKPFDGLPVLKASLDKNDVNKISSFTGDVKAKISHDKQGNTMIEMNSIAFWDFLSGTGVWYLAGGVFMLIAIIALYFFQARGTAWSSFLAGLTLLAGTYLIEKLLVWISVIVAVAVMIGIGYDIWKHRSNIKGKTMLEVAKDIIDDGKVIDSVK